jgi:hypothetical protein
MIMGKFFAWLQDDYCHFRCPYVFDEECLQSAQLQL